MEPTDRTLTDEDIRTVDLGSSRAQETDPDADDVDDTDADDTDDTDADDDATDDAGGDPDTVDTSGA
jgi:hypothetical protein